MKTSKTKVLSTIVLAMLMLSLFPLLALADDAGMPSWAAAGSPLILPADTPNTDYDKGYNQNGIMPLEAFSPDGAIEMLPVPVSTLQNAPPISAAAAEDFEVVKLLDNGPDSECIVLSILGDGFTASQQDYFITSAQTVSDYLLNFFPFSSFKDKFNIYAVKVISNVSGAAQRPTALIDNYFGSTYYYDGVTERLLYTSYPAKVNEVLNTYTPTYNIPIVIVNATVYGGAGGTWAVTSLEASAKEILVHELGHSVGNLADEYWWRGYEAPNLTANNNTATNKWRHWLGFESIGIYPHSESPNWFRPHQNCEMRYLNRAFCEVCASQLTLTLSNIANEPFYGRSNLTDASLPEGKTRIGDYLYYGCEELETVTIPSSVSSIGRYTFLRCQNLTDVADYAIIPQPINATTFAGVDRSNITLYVPTGTVAAYQTAGWTGFKAVLERTYTTADYDYQLAKAKEFIESVTIYNHDAIVNLNWYHYLPASIADAKAYLKEFVELERIAAPEFRFMTYEQQLELAEEIYDNILAAYDMLVKYTFIAYLQPSATEILSGDTFYVDVMLTGDYNFTQVIADVAYDNTLLEYQGYSNLYGWVAACAPVAPTAVKMRSVPSANSISGEPCLTALRMVTLMFKVKEGLTGDLDTVISFSTISVSPTPGFIGATCAPGEPLAVTLKQQ